MKQPKVVKIKIEVNGKMGVMWVCDIENLKELNEIRTKVDKALKSCKAWEEVK